jgi:hypothetical protein
MVAWTSLLARGLEVDLESFSDSLMSRRSCVWIPAQKRDQLT